MHPVELWTSAIISQSTKPTQIFFKDRAFSLGQVGPSFLPRQTQNFDEGKLSQIQVL